MDSRLIEYYRSNTTPFKAYQAIIADIVLLSVQVLLCIKKIHTPFGTSYVTATVIMALLFLITIVVSVLLKGNKTIVSNLFNVYAIGIFTCLTYLISEYQWYYVILSNIPSFCAAFLLHNRVKKKLLNDTFKQGVVSNVFLWSTFGLSLVLGVVIKRIHAETHSNIVPLIGAMVFSLLAFFELILLFYQIVVEVKYKEK